MISKRLRKLKSRLLGDRGKQIEAVKVDWDNYVVNAAYLLKVIVDAESHMKSTAERYDKGAATLEELNEAKRAFNMAQHGRKELAVMVTALEIQYSELPKRIRKKLKAAGIHLPEPLRAKERNFGI